MKLGVTSSSYMAFIAVIQKLGEANSAILGTGDEFRRRIDVQCLLSPQNAN